jgi:hypothetical protein
VNVADGGASVYNPEDTPGVNPFGRPYPGSNSPSPPPSHYDSGPQRRGKASSKPPPAPPPDPWAGVAGAVRDQANALVDKFMATVGYLQGIDATSLAQRLAKSGTNITGSPFGAYEWLWGNALNDSQRQANPWSEFGMGKDDYNQTVSKLNSVMASWTGDSFDANTLKNAIWGSWTPDQIRNFAMFGNPEGTGQLSADAQLSGADPWVGMGQTYAQTLQGFEAFEGAMPTDKATLAAWFRFGVGARQLGAGATATVTQAPQQIGRLSSEVR